MDLVQNWADEPPGASYVRELAMFVSVHLGRVPGILWPEHDHPALRPGASPEELAVLADDLGDLLAMEAASWRIEPAETGLQIGSAQRHTLFHQTAGTGVWWLCAGREGAHASGFQAYRLRVSEVLYVPVHWRWLVDLGPGAALVHTSLRTAGDAPDDGP